MQIFLLSHLTFAMICILVSWNSQHVLMIDFGRDQN